MPTPNQHIGQTIPMSRLAGIDGRRHEVIPRTIPMDYLYHIDDPRPSRQEQEPEQSSETEGFSVDHILDWILGAGGRLQKYVGDLGEDVLRNVVYSEPGDYEKNKNAPAVQAVDYLKNRGRSLIEDSYHQYEDFSIPYIAQQVVGAYPESQAIALTSVLAGGVIGGPLGTAGRMGLGLLGRLPAAAKGVEALSGLYNNSKVAQFLLPNDAKNITAVFTGAGLEAYGEAKENEERALAQGMSREEAQKIFDNTFRDNMAIISGFNLPQYNLLLGRGRGLLGTLGRLATVSGLEGAEELAQVRAGAYERGEDPTWEEQRDAATVGAILGLGTGGVTELYGRHREANAKKAQEEAEKLIQDIRDGTFRREYFRRRDESIARQSVNLGTLRNWAVNERGYSPNVVDMIVRIAGEEGMPADKVLALAMQESQLNQNEVSRAGAIGVMQLTPETADELGVNPDDLEQNIRGGVRRLKQGYDKFGDWDLAFAAYNAGLNAVTDHVPQNGETEHHVAGINRYLSEMPYSSGEVQTGGRQQDNGGNIFGTFENYGMPDESTGGISSLKPGWAELLPQIGGVLKNKFNVVPIITSCGRDADHNASVGGSPNSDHLIRGDGADAVDIVLLDENGNLLTPEDAQPIVDYFISSGLFGTNSSGVIQVFYHNVQTGDHLHLGHLLTDKLGQPVGQQGTTKNTYDPNFSDRQNEVWQAAIYASRRLRNEHGIRLSPELIYRQWALEDGGEFTHSSYNWGGLKGLDGNFRTFQNDKEHADAYVDDFMAKRGDEINGYADENGNMSDENFIKMLLETGYITESDVAPYSEGFPGKKAPNAGATLKTTADRLLQSGKNGRLGSDNSNQKPLFDLSSNSRQTQEIIEKFARKRFEEAVQKGDPDTVSFFRGMFDDEGNFISTLANRRALAERESVGLTMFATAMLAGSSQVQAETQEQGQSQPSQQPKQSSPQPSATNPNDRLRISPVTAAGQQYLQTLRDSGQQQDAVKALQLQAALKANDEAAVENILKQNNVPITATQPVQTPPQPTEAENVVKQNGTPENVVKQNDATKNPEIVVSPVTDFYFNFLSQKVKENPEERAFVFPLFNNDGEFINTPENRQAVKKRYGKEFTQYFNENAPEELKTQLKPQKKGLTGDEKTIALARRNVSENNLASRKTQGKALLKVAEKNGIEIPEDDKKRLSNGVKTVVKTWRDTLLGKGLLETQPAEQPAPAQPQPQQEAQQEPPKQPEKSPLIVQADRIIQERQEQLRQQQLKADEEKQERIRQGQEELEEEERRNIQIQENQRREREFYEDEDLDETGEEAVAWRQQAREDIRKHEAKQTIERNKKRKEEEQARQKAEWQNNRPERVRRVKAALNLSDDDTTADLAMSDVAENHSDRVKQGNALVQLLDLPQFRYSGVEVKEAEPLKRQLAHGSGKAIGIAQNYLDQLKAPEKVKPQTRELIRTPKTPDEIASEQRAREQKKKEKEHRKARMEELSDDAMFESEQLDTRANYAEGVEELFENKAREDELTRRQHQQEIRQSRTDEERQQREMQREQSLENRRQQQFGRERQDQKRAEQRRRQQLNQSQSVIEEQQEPEGRSSVQAEDEQTNDDRWQLETNERLSEQDNQRDVQRQQNRDTATRRFAEEGLTAEQNARRREDESFAKETQDELNDEDMLDDEMFDTRLQENENNERKAIHVQGKIRNDRSSLDDENVFDRLPETDELNDVESEEATVEPKQEQQKTPPETPVETEKPQAEEPPVQNKETYTRKPNDPTEIKTARKAISKAPVGTQIKVKKQVNNKGEIEEQEATYRIDANKKGTRIFQEIDKNGQPVGKPYAYRDSDRIVGGGGSAVAGNSLRRSGDFQVNQIELTYPENVSSKETTTQKNGEVTPQEVGQNGTTTKTAPETGSENAEEGNNQNAESGQTQTQSEVKKTRAPKRTREQIEADNKRKEKEKAKERRKKELYKKIDPKNTRPHARQIISDMVNRDDSDEQTTSSNYIREMLKRIETMSKKDALELGDRWEKEGKEAAEKAKTESKPEVEEKEPEPEPKAETKPEPKSETKPKPAEPAKTGITAKDVKNRVGKWRLTAKPEKSRKVAAQSVINRMDDPNDPMTPEEANAEISKIIGDDEKTTAKSKEQENPKKKETAEDISNKNRAKKLYSDWRKRFPVLTNSTKKTDGKAQEILRKMNDGSLSSNQALNKMQELLSEELLFLEFIEKSAKENPVFKEDVEAEGLSFRDDGTVAFPNNEITESLREFLDQITKWFSTEGDADTRIIHIVKEKDLSTFQKLFVNFGKKLGVKVRFFNNPDERFHGAFSRGRIYLNVNSQKPVDKVFWHEALHWMKASVPELYNQFIKAANITDAQRTDFLARTKRKDLKTNEEIDEEIIADEFHGMAKRTGLLQSIAGKNRGLIQRVMQWISDTLNKFIEIFRNPHGRLTTAQAQALANEFGKTARQLKDKNGKPIFRYNNRTHSLELADGTKLPTVSRSTPTKYEFAGVKAKTVNKDMLAKAIQMKKDGKSPDEIWQATGFIEGEDGLWRFEIEDDLDAFDLDKVHAAIAKQKEASKLSEAELLEKIFTMFSDEIQDEDGEIDWSKIDFFKNKLQNNVTFKLGEIYDNPKLYEAYPFLADMHVTFEPLDDAAGHYRYDTKSIEIDTDDADFWALSILHEIQHAIQHFEGFAIGGSSETAREYIETQLKQELAKETDAKKRINIQQQLHILSEMSDDDIYLKLGGEQEAREVEVRAARRLIKNQDITAAQWRLKELSKNRVKLKGVKETLDNLRSKLTPEQEVVADKYATMQDQIATGLDADEGYLLSEEELADLSEEAEELAKDLPKNLKDAIREFYQLQNDISNLEDSVQDLNERVKTTNALKNNAPKIHDKAFIGRDDGGGSASRAKSNNSQSAFRRVKNKFASLFEDKNPNRKEIIRQTLSDLSGYNVKFGYVEGDLDVVVSNLQKTITARHAYQWKEILPVVGEKIAENLGLTPTDALNNYIVDWLMTGKVGTNTQEEKSFAAAMRNNPEKRELLQLIRDTFEEIANMSAQERVKSSIRDRKQEKPFKQKVKEFFSKEEMLDDTSGLERMVERMVEDAADPAVADIIKKTVNPHQMALLLKGKGALADMMIGDEKMTEEDMKRIRTTLGELYPSVDSSNFHPLGMIIQKAGGDVRGLETYAIAKMEKEMHEKTREVDPKTGKPKYPKLRPEHSEADCDEIIKNGKNDFDEAQKLMVDYANTLLAMKYSAGLLTDKTYYSVINGWKNYVPMARVFEEDEGFDLSKSLEGEKTGSERDTWSPIKKLAANTDEFLLQAERNKLKQEVATLVRFGGFGNIITEEPKGNSHGTSTPFWENGVKKYLVTPDKSIIRALEAARTPADKNVIMRVFRVTASFLRAAYTSLNPDFWIGNPFRDLADAYIHNKHLSMNPITALLEMWRAGFKGVYHRNQDFWDMLGYGGAQSGFVSASTDSTSRRIDSITRGKKGFKSIFSRVLGKMEDIAEMSEYVTRLNTYTSTKNKLAEKRGGKVTSVDKALAALSARSASVDFAKAGASIRSINRHVLFTNAVIQSLNLWRETLRPSKLKTPEGKKEAFGKIFRTLMGGVFLTLVQAALNYSDDDRYKKYKDRQNWEKETYWIFGDGLQIPKGMDIGIRLLSALTDESIDWMIHNDPVEWERIAKTFKDGFPSITATIATPLIESYVNYSIFRDAPIVPYGQQDLPAAMQFDKKTSWVAKNLGEAIDFSPRKIDHLISGYLGTMGRWATGGLDETPVLRRFMFDPEKNPKVVSDYYKALEKQEKIYTDWQAERKIGKNVKLPDDYDRALHARLKSIREPLRNISKREMQILNNSKLSDDECEKQIRELERRRADLCRRALGQAR